MITKNYSVRAEFSNYPLVDYNTVSTAEQTSTIMFELFDACDGVVLTPQPQSQTVPAQASYDSTDVVFTYTPYTAVPVTCPVTTNCMSVTANPDLGKTLPCQQIDNNTGTVTWNFSETDYTNQDVPPGTYTFTYEVEAGTETQTFTVDVVLPDPCDPPTSMSPAAPFVNQDYTLTAQGQSYTHPDFTVDPTFCPEPTYTYS